MAKIPTSPAVVYIEKDNSFYPPNIDSSIVGIIGFASKGEPNKAVLITTQEQLINEFGEPSESIYGQGLEGALEILEATNQMRFVRALPSDAKEASSYIQFGSCPAIKFDAMGFGIEKDLYLKVQVTDNNGVEKFSPMKEFSFDSATLGSLYDNQAEAMASIIGKGETVDEHVSIVIDPDDMDTCYLVGNYAGSNASLTVSSFLDNTFETPIKAFEVIDSEGNNIIPPPVADPKIVYIPNLLYSGSVAEALFTTGSLDLTDLNGSSITYSATYLTAVGATREIKETSFFVTGSDFGDIGSVEYQEFYGVFTGTTAYYDLTSFGVEVILLNTTSIGFSSADIGDYAKLQFGVTGAPGQFNEGALTGILGLQGGTTDGNYRYFVGVTGAAGTDTKLSDIDPNNRSSKAHGDGTKFQFFVTGVDGSIYDATALYGENFTTIEDLTVFINGAFVTPAVTASYEDQKIYIQENAVDYPLEDNYFDFYMATSIQGNALGYDWGETLLDPESRPAAAKMPDPVSGLELTRESIQYKVESLFPGEGYNYVTKDDGTPKGATIEVDNRPVQNVLITVNNDGVQAETFEVGVVKGLKFFETAINVGTDNPTSDYIKANIELTGSVDIEALTDWSDKFTVITGGLSAFDSEGNQVNPRFVKPLELASRKLENGSNGTMTGDDGKTALIGNSANKTGIYAIDDDAFNISIASVPGISDQSVQNTLITLAESTQNFLAVLSPPVGLDSAQDTIDWINGRSSTRTAAINSSWATVAWPWVQVFSVFDSKDRWYDPAIFLVRQMVFTDAVADPWFAPAGFRRGRLTKPIATEVPMSQGDRDALYSNAINPIVNFVPDGITIFGQKTTQRLASALDRINVRRMMIYIRKLLLVVGRQDLFEPNDEFTWEIITDKAESVLQDIKSRRGITDYRVICDETTNTPIRVDRNELWCKILLKPTKTAEWIVFEVNLTNQSAKFSG